MLLILICLNITLGLCLESTNWPGALIVVNLVTWLHFIFRLYQSENHVRVELCLCLLLATFGEIVLSEICGLYHYRLGHLPLFVPPGHVLLYLAGVQVSRQWGRFLTWLVPALLTPLNLYLWWRGLDTNGLICYSVFLLLIWRGQNRQLYATMFVLALAMEIFGTRLHSWTWVAAIPSLGLTNLNPPISAGIFYCLLDLLVVTFAPRSPVWSWQAIVARESVRQEKKEAA